MVTILELFVILAIHFIAIFPQTQATYWTPPCCKPDKFPALPGSPDPLLDFLENTDTENVEVKLASRYHWQTPKDMQVSDLFDSQWRLDHGLQEPRRQKETRRVKNMKSRREEKPKREKKPKSFEDLLGTLHYIKPPPAVSRWTWNRIPDFLPIWEDRFGGNQPPAYPVQPQCWAREQGALNGNYGGLRLCHDMLLVHNIVVESKRDWPWDLQCEAMYEGVRTTVYGKAIREGAAKGSGMEIAMGIEWLMHSCPRAHNCYDRFCPVGGVNSAYGNGHYTVIVMNQ